MSLVDSHAHLDFLSEGRTVEQVLSDAKEAGLNKIICVGTSIEESKRCIEIAEKFSNKNVAIYATCGIHPQDGKSEIEKLGLLHCFKTLKRLAQSSKKVVAIGECGLDYFLETSNQRPFDGTQGKPVTSDEEKELQRELFKEQIKLATDLNLPLVVHCRNGWEEIFEILEREQGPTLPFDKLRIKPETPQGRSFTLSGVFHCWTGNWEAAKRALDLGFYISFSGIVTFKNASDIREAAKKAPLDRILIETDSPFLTPEPLRSASKSLSASARVKQNEPKNVRIIAAFIAGLRGVPFDKIAEATTLNAQRLFGV